MEISDLIIIGSLDYNHKRRSNYIRIESEFLHLLPKLKNIFLIFKDYRVRYGIIDIAEIISINTAKITFRDYELQEEFTGIKSVRVALDEEEINMIDENTIYYEMNRRGIK
jgi:hypothetical protein